MYLSSTLGDSDEPESRAFKTVNLEGVIDEIDTVQLFHIDSIDDSGRSDLFAKEIVKVTELTQEVLTLVMPKILFTFRSADALTVFSETFAAHLSVCKVVPELNIEVDFAADMTENEREELAIWQECTLPHGREVNTHDHYQRWISALQPLPSTANILIVFSRIWRDFRELRGLAKKFNLPSRTIKFQFSERSPHIQQEDHDFFMRETIAAIKDLDIPEQEEISGIERARLVKFGCRGFGTGQRPTA